MPAGAADGMLSLHGISKPVTLEFTWTPGAKPVLSGKATVSRLAFPFGDDCREQPFERAPLRREGE